MQPCLATTKIIDCDSDGALVYRHGEIVFMRKWCVRASSTDHSFPHQEIVLGLVQVLEATRVTGTAALHSPYEVATDLSA